MSSAIKKLLADPDNKKVGMTMRKSKQETARTRERIVKPLHRRCIADDLMSAAGLTHGGSYRHFAWKDQLVAEAGAAAMAATTEKIAAAASREPG